MALYSKNGIKYNIIASLGGQSADDIIEQMWRNRFHREYIDQVLKSLTSEQQLDFEHKAQTAINEQRKLAESQGQEILVGHSIL